MKTARQMITALVFAASVTLLPAAVLAQDLTCGRYGGVAHTNGIARQTMDPAIAVFPYYTINWIYDPVLRLTQDLQYIPWLVEAMPTETQHNVYTFKLRSGIKFHDGTPLDAEAVKFAIDRLAGGKVPSSFTGLWKKNLDEVVVTGDLTFEIRLKQDWPGFFYTLATSSFVPSPTAVKKYGNGFGVDAAVGSGPFKLVSFRPGEYLEVKRNDDYFMKGIPCLDGAIATQVASGSVRSLALQSGDMEVLNTFPEAQIPELLADPAVTIKEGENSTLSVFLVNTKKPALADLRVRQAIQYAINGQEMIDAVYGGKGGMVTGLYPSWHPAYIPLDDVSIIRQNLDKAQQLLKQAGYGPSHPLQLDLITASGQAHVDRGVLAQAQLSQIGITLKVESLPNTAYTQRQNSLDFDLSLFQFDGSPLLADYSWTLFGATSGSNLTGYNQPGGVQDPRAEELSKVIAASDDAGKVHDQLVEFQKLIFQDLPVIFLNYRNHRTAWINKLHNLSTSKLKGREDWYQVWLEK